MKRIGSVWGVVDVLGRRWSTAPWYGTGLTVSTGILAAILNDGCSPHTGAKLLRPETVQGKASTPYFRNSRLTHTAMFTDQIPAMPIKSNEYTPTGKPEIANATPLQPGPEDLSEGRGLSFALSHAQSPTGRAAGSASWDGVANLFWFADRENGIGGVVASQILLYEDLEVVGCSGAVESIIYNDLVHSHHCWPAIIPQSSSGSTPRGLPELLLADETSNNNMLDMSTGPRKALAY
ncbi:uncharacterized protein DSM5745_03245 [Aspergillus mulundensis]|uniref:Beta-lactamase-related domain-containing protein n=1 Tax=Aspergillus mulundensis TaxID=1810919 RepID=A0A3D8SJX2_9EURO|nr:hypothetical protein DSM5745_03245 [Aspergillus mulundensis]RDW86603.1 hypothetical protein DSM5745_03245 [Aspergillus mulundensis]